MEKSEKRGINFGITSGVITTLGLMMGLISSTYSRLAVIGGIVTIAVADAMSDSLGMHISEESVGETKRQIWKSMKYTFLSKFVLALSFLIPFFILESLWQVMIASALWGGFLLIFSSMRIARINKEKPVWVIAEHLLIAIGVLVITFFLGKFVAVYLA